MEYLNLKNDLISVQIKINWLQETASLLIHLNQTLLNFTKIDLLI
jgi:hypothetical protein